MSWTNELYRVFELLDGKADNLAPVSHSTANAQIEVTIDEQGNFKSATTVQKGDEETIIPVYEDSVSRSNNKAPHPLDDELKYVAGDYNKYVAEKCENIYHNEYMKSLTEWKNSSYTHSSIQAVFSYLQRATLIHDLITAGILEVDANGILTKKKINNIEQKDAFVRFIIQYSSLNLFFEPKTWLDLSLRNEFQKYNAKKLNKEQLCYAIGKKLPYTYKHPKKIIGSAKIISSNDKKGFSYRGRFSNQEEAISVSYDFSQKMHNALKYLIKNQGLNYGTLTLVIWASAFQELPNEIQHNIEDDWGDEESYDSLPEYRAWLSRYLTGYKQKLQTDHKVMIMGLNATSKGRLSISMYDELRGSDFLNNLEMWHSNSACKRFDYKKKKYVVKSCSLYEIIRAAYGSEEKGKNKKEVKIKCDNKLFRDNILRLLPCIMKRQHLPQDLIRTLYYKASNPLSYNKINNHQFVIEVICSMIRAKMNEKKNGVDFMAYDPNEKDRSYLYGCLLAIADKAERDTYETDKEKNERITNARRYWSRFSQRPYQTWRIIEEHLRPYLNKHKYKNWIEQKVQEITDKFTTQEFSDDSRLEPLYLLGYHHFMSYMYQNNQKEEN